MPVWQQAARIEELAVPGEPFVGVIGEEQQQGRGSELASDGGVAVVVVAQGEARGERLVGESG